LTASRSTCSWELVRDLELHQHDFPRSVERENVETIAVLLELCELVAEDEQRLAHQVRVIDDPALQGQFVDPSLERHRPKGRRRLSRDEQEARREGVHIGRSTGHQAGGQAQISDPRARNNIWQVTSRSTRVVSQPRLAAVLVVLGALLSFAGDDTGGPSAQLFAWH
jgi:hypothetical protein